MKKFAKCFGLLVLGLTMVFVGKSFAYDFGDFRSVTITGKAWAALKNGDLESVLAYTNKNLELYAGEAKKMQAGLTEYPSGSEADVHAYWALNDVGTSLFIQGEAYRRANMKEEAQKSFQTLIDDYSYSQCWDPKGWFWKPADGAKEKLAIMESGVDVDFSDNSSSALVTKAWEALSAKDLKAVQMYTDKVIDLYSEKAKEMQASLKTYAWESKEEVFKLWALNDVGTALFIRGKALEDAGKPEEAKEAYETLINDYQFAQCWDNGGWFWKPAEAAQKQLDDINNATPTSSESNEAVEEDEGAASDEDASMEETEEATDDSEATSSEESE